MRQFSKAALLASAGVVVAGDAQASVNYTTPGPHDLDHKYTQNFDSLPATPTNTSLQDTIPWTDDSTSSSTQTSLPGWYLYHPITQAEGGANGHQRLRIGTGNSSTGSFWDFGPSGNSDRALGSLNSNTMSTPTDNDPPPATLEEQQMFIGFRVKNGTQFTLTSFTVSYNGEQWRNGAGSAETWNFEYSFDQTATISSPHALYIAASGGDFTTPVTGGTAGALDGNNNNVTVNLTVNNIVWAPGTELMLRWADTNMAGADHGMAIDNFGFSANGDLPEPAGLGVLALGAVALMRRRPAKQVR